MWMQVRAPSRQHRETLQTTQEFQSLLQLLPDLQQPGGAVHQVRRQPGAYRGGYSFF